MSEVTHSKIRVILKIHIYYINYLCNVKYVSHASLVNTGFIGYNHIMIQKTYLINSIDGLKDAAGRIRSKHIYGTASCKVLLTWARIWDPADFDVFRDKVHTLFPEFITLGTNNYGNEDILKGRLDGSGPEHSITLSFLFFEDSGASLIDIEPGIREESREGKEINACLKAINDVKGVYLVPNNYFCSAEAVLEEAVRGYEGIPFFGIKTSLMPEYRVFGYKPDGDIVENRLFALAFYGKTLAVRSHYNLGWTPVGRMMTVTKEENPFFVDEIDGLPATNVYNKYLGLKNEQIIPENLSEFPLIVYRNDMKISRIGISGPKEGQLIFGAPVYPGDRICLSYGNPDDLFEEISLDCDEIEDFDPQGCILLTCANRIMLLGEREPEETDLYKKLVKSAAVVYGYAEIFSLNGNGGELNSALVSVVFREDCTNDNLPAVSSDTDDTDQYGVTGKDHHTEDNRVPFSDRLSRFFKEMSNDLVAAAEEAAKANRARSAFYSMLSHEIRTPLNSILGMNEMILRESHEAEILEYSESISHSGEILLQLINDVLDTEKIEAGKMKIVPVEYDPSELIKSLSDMIGVNASGKGLKLNVIKGDNLPSLLFGDEARIRQCAINILNNAVKYTQKGEVTLKVDTRPVDKDHIFLDISVKDTGIGIRPEDIEKLSIPFERLELSRNYKVEGSGLGLNIVRKLLELMGSELRIESTYGKGSEFSFGIMQEVRESKAPDDNNADVTSSERNDVRTFTAPGASILIVDDTASNIKIMKLFLKNSLIDIDSAPDGMTAAAMSKNRKYDIIFLDHLMPDMDGLETFKIIRADKDNPNTDSVYVMLTANDGSGVRESFLREGFDDFMTKPVKTADLEALLGKYLKNYT